MSRRSPETVWRSALARVTAVDRDQLAVAVIVGGAVLALGSVALGGFVRYERLADALYPLAVLLPAIGVVVAFGALWWAATVAESRTDAGESPLLEDPDRPPERGHSRTTRSVALETTWLLEDGAGEWYRCRRRDDDATGEVRERLTDGAVRTLRAKRGLEPAAAREAVRSGTWTDDEVAAAFLAEADDVRQPAAERFRAAIDPGRAFDRRVRRTLTAIESIGDDSRSLADDPRALERDRDRTRTADTQAEGETATETEVNPDR